MKVLNKILLANLLAGLLAQSALAGPRPEAPRDNDYYDALDFLVHDDKQSRLAIADTNELGATHLREREIDALMDFLHALTDPASLDLRHDVPHEVPSGLPVYD